jgi:MFS superfamily sulfate permease-like transporter
LSFSQWDLAEIVSGRLSKSFLMTFVMFGYPWIETMPLAAFIGVMFVVAKKPSNGESFGF